MTNLAEDLLNHALALAKRGFKVFPLEIDGNKPAHEGWQEQATTDPAEIRALWTDPFGQMIPFNTGVATGQGLTVVDVDTKSDRPGLESLDELVTFLGLDDDTFTVRTRSGGLHLYFKSDGLALRNSASKVRPAIDIRSEGGYVVAPGSSIGGKAYKLERDRPLKPIAPWFAELCGRKTPKGESSEPLVELDTPEAIDAAVRWLQTEAPTTVADSGNGDHTAYKVACRVKDFGISEGECLGLILSHYDEERCYPPQGSTVWEKKVENAYQHGQNPPGVKHPMADFEIEVLEKPESAAPKPKAQRHVFVKGYQSETLLASFADDFLVDDLLECHAVSCLYGPSSVGKTFIMLDLALHVASGRPWNGHETRKGAVIYVAAEGTRGIHKRIAAWSKHHGVDLRDVWFSSRPSPIDLLSADGDTNSFIEAAMVECAAWGEAVKPALIVIDTLSRALAGGDENSSVDMGAFVKHIDRIKTATGAHVSIVHHSGKDAARGMRGWSGMRAAIDTEMEVQKSGVLSTNKQRDGEELDDQEFMLQTIELGADRRGKPIKSAVAVYGAAVEMMEPPELEGAQKTWFLDLEQGVSEMAEEQGLPVNEFKFGWQQAELIWREKRKKTVFAHGQKEGVAKSPRQAVLYRLQNLAKNRVLREVERNQWVIA